jgi:hypothetical protein
MADPDLQTGNVNKSWSHELIVSRQLPARKCYSKVLRPKLIINTGGIAPDL